MYSKNISVYHTDLNTINSNRWSHSLILMLYTGENGLATKYLISHVRATVALIYN